jgi:hypothetical protein
MRDLYDKNGLVRLPVALLLGLVVIVGCERQGPASQIAAANNSNIRRLGNLYKAYQLRNGNQGPADEAAFKKFLHEMSPTRLERMQIDANNIDGLFVSERDGQPFVIRYKVSGGIGSVDPVVFEQNGSGGKRQVGFSDGSVEEVDQSRYDQLLQGGK